MKRTYEITFWTEPKRTRPAYITKRVFTATSKSEAIYDAEDMFPEWSIIAVKETEERR